MIPHLHTVISLYLLYHRLYLLYKMMHRYLITRFKIFHILLIGDKKDIHLTEQTIYERGKDHEQRYLRWSIRECRR